MSSNQYIRPSQPDVLEVIANLSNDAVFTPPRVVNAVLDLLPSHVWTDPNLRWLDPAAKTGVFPREITRRLMIGIVEIIPDEQTRLDHILNNMVFAFATEAITGMMTRRSLYCAKDASSTLSAAQLPTPNGNVWHQRVEHAYDTKGRCTECGGTSVQLEQPGLDNRAYGFIHKEGRNQITKEINMKFDVIVGNPPYQMDADGSNRAMPIYNLFVEEAKKLKPQYIAMIMPSRWMAGGLGLGEFRSTMLNDKRISKLVDFPNAGEVFPGVEIKGGVCYFMWDASHEDECESVLVRDGNRSDPVMRNLGTYDVFVRETKALKILAKVQAKNKTPLSEVMSARTAFGIVSNFQGFHKTKQKGDVRFYATSTRGRVEAWIPRSEALTNMEAINSWKAMVPKAGSDGGQKLPDVVLGQPWTAEKPSICTQSFLFVQTNTKEEAESVCSYYRTRFVRFLVSLRKITQDTTRDSYLWVPQQTWDRTWTDAALYKKYGITKEEQEYIESMVKEMQP